MTEKAKLNSPLFGTDGVRGTANVEPLTVGTCVRLGRSAALALPAAIKTAVAVQSFEARGFIQFPRCN